MVRQVCGGDDENLRVLERLTGLACRPVGTSIALEGDPDEVRLAERLLRHLHQLAQRGVHLGSADIERAIKTAQRDSSADLLSLLGAPLLTTRRGRRIVPKTQAQKAYVDAIDDCDVVFGIGPAGTGKTYLAMVKAVDSLLKKQVQRIVLCRPAVEAGESLGFLPGTLADKVDPYLRPLYDALHDLLDFDQVGRLMERGAIEVAPLAFMRGRTLNDSFVILDEAQNTTSDQMKMFLTRLGFGSVAVVTGDVTQIDLPRHEKSGLKHALNIVANIPGVSVTHFKKEDVVRHPLVQAIVEAYEVFEAQHPDGAAH
ncbi:MAG: PhoH family protein [Pseudomonadota bacterium]|nr:PhoH family protein [Pseudomonadota bacterium]